MWGGQRGLQRTARRTLKNAKTFFCVCANSSVGADRQRFAALVSIFFKPSANPLKVFQ